MSVGCCNGDASPIYLPLGWNGDQAASNRLGPPWVDASLRRTYNIEDTTPFVNEKKARTGRGKPATGHAAREDVAANNRPCRVHAARFKPVSEGGLDHGQGQRDSRPRPLRSGLQRSSLGVGRESVKSVLPTNALETKIFRLLANLQAVAHPQGQAVSFQSQCNPVRIIRYRICVLR